MLVRRRAAAWLATLLAICTITLLQAQDRPVSAPPGDASLSWTAEVTTSVRAAFTRLGHSLTAAIPRVIATGLTLLVFWGLATLVRLLARRLARRLSSPTLRLIATQAPYIATWAIGASRRSTRWASTLASGHHRFRADRRRARLRPERRRVEPGERPADPADTFVRDRRSNLHRHHEGTVERIEARATHIRTYDGRLVLRAQRRDPHLARHQQHRLAVAAGVDRGLDRLRGRPRIGDAHDRHGHPRDRWRGGRPAADQ